MMSTISPVKIHLDIDTNMKMVGKRFPYYTTYQVRKSSAVTNCTDSFGLWLQAGFDNDGTINGIIMNIYGNSGCYNNDMPITDGMMFIDNGMDL